MGTCCSHHQDQSHTERIMLVEEDIIQDNEKHAPFHSIELKRIDKCLQDRQYNCRLNKPIIRQVLQDLNLDLKLINDPDCPQFKYFEAFLDSDKLYTQRKLVLSAVLTSKESNKKKVKVIGKYYDFSHNSSLEKDEIEGLLEEAVSASVKIIPLMALNNGYEVVEGNLISQETYQKYTDYLLIGKKEFIEKYSNLIIGDKLTLPFEDFQKAFSQNLGLEILLTAKAIRLELFKLSKSLKIYE